MVNLQDYIQFHIYTITKTSTTLISNFFPLHLNLQTNKIRNSITFLHLHPSLKSPENKEKLLNSKSTENKEELLNSNTYLQLPENIIKPTNILSTNIQPIISTSFNKVPLDWAILHRCCGHISDNKLAQMCRLGTLKDLPPRFSTTHQIHRCQCWMFWQDKSKHIPYGPTIDTTKLPPGSLIHMDFMFPNTTSIRGFTSILLIVHA